VHCKSDVYVKAGYNGYEVSKENDEYRNDKSKKLGNEKSTIALIKNVKE